MAAFCSEFSHGWTLNGSNLNSHPAIQCLHRDSLLPQVPGLKLHD